jgi:transposase
MAYEGMATSCEEPAMPPYSPDLRERVLADCDAGMATSKVAAKFSVSTAWVRRLKQRRRETGSTAPVEQRHGPEPRWAEHAGRIAEAVRERPDDTLAEHRERLGLPLSVATLSRAMRALGLTVKKKS